MTGACTLLFDVAALDSSSSDGAGDATLEGGALDDSGDDDAAPQLCGTPARSCLGGACVANRCQPLVLARDEPFPTALALDATHVYWINVGTSDAGQADGALRRVRKDGSSSETLWTDPAFRGLSSLAVDASHVYVTIRASGAVIRVPKNGGDASVVSSSETNPAQVQLDEARGRLFWLNAASNDVVREHSLGVGSAPRTMAKDTPSFFGGGLSVSPTHVYWTNHETRAVKRVPREGCPDADTCAQSIAEDGGTGVDKVRVDGDDLFWAAQDGNGEIWLSGLDGGQRARLVESTKTVRGLAVDRDHLYYAVQAFLEPSGAVMRVRRDGSAFPELVAAELTWPGAIALDDEAIYLVTSGRSTGFGEFDARDGTVLKIAK